MGMQPAMAIRLPAKAIAAVIGGFSLFVGFNKALAPLDVLRAHTAWTIHLPMPLGRTLGWLEIGAALVLIGSIFLPSKARAGFLAAAWITLNHAVAAVVHMIHREFGALPQSAVLITLCLALLALQWRLALEPSTTTGIPIR